MTSLQAQGQEDLATIRLDGRAVFQVGPAEDGTSARERARRVEGRLGALLRNIDLLGPPIARQGADGWSVVVSGVSVVSVTPRDAEDNLTTTKALARQWAEALGAGPASGCAVDATGAGAGGWSPTFARQPRPPSVACWSRPSASCPARWPRCSSWQRSESWRACFALFVALDALGFDPTTVAAGLGLTGIVLGFAIKDILSNFVSGVLILALRPFEIGDQIVVGNLEGTVERIELRAKLVVRRSDAGAPGAPEA